MRVSICVCTHNRAHILTYCLEALANLKVPVGCEAEVLVVDNDSVDNTKEVVGTYSQRSPIKILYLHEPQRGLSVARNRAIEEALVTISASWMTTVPCRQIGCRL